MKIAAAIERYLARHALPHCAWDDLPPPAPGLRLGVVIPCLAESASLAAVLDSLAAGSTRLSEAEVLVVVNRAADAPADVIADNRRSLDLLAGRAGDGLRVLALDRSGPGRAFAPAAAGVGLARRVGMDVALARLAAGRPERATIACLDGDSPVRPGYVDALLARFDRDDAPLGGVCQCLHPIPADPELAAAIVAYETWMRYFEAGLAAAGSPFSYPTVGSCLVASAGGYALADGMPTRQAGEDFYFAQKLIKISGRAGLAHLNEAVVEPAARLSARVPFGTGRAMLRCRDEGPDAYRFAEPAQAFFDLRRWFAAFEAGFDDADALRRAAPTALRSFLDDERAWPRLASIRSNRATAADFALACHHWFDGLRCVRYAHASERALGRKWIYPALRQVLGWLGREEKFADLDDPDPARPDAQLQIRWLQRLRDPDPD